jgi:hypothetical protein
MRDRDLRRTTRAFAEIRAAQSLAANAQAVEAHLALSRMNDALQAERELQTGRQQAWSEMVSRPGLDLELSRAWAWAMLNGEAAVDGAARAARRADSRRNAIADEARAARARSEAAEDIARTVARRAQRRDDEASIADAEDRFVWKRGRQ